MKIKEGVTAEQLKECGFYDGGSHYNKSNASYKTNLSIDKKTRVISEEFDTYPSPVSQRLVQDLVRKGLVE